MNKFDKTSHSDPFVNKNKIAPYSSGKLSGLSFAVKDNIDVANEITGYGSPDWTNTHSKSVVNAICIEQLLNKGNYIPRAMGINAISSLSCAPQITIPIAEVNGVPIGFHF